MALHRSPPALAGAACALALAAVYVVAFHVGSARDADQQMLIAFQQVGVGDAYVMARKATHLVDPWRFAVLVTALVSIALLRRRRDLAAATLVICVGSGVATQVLKAFTGGLRDPIGDLVSYWPSGHTTAATAFGVCVTLVAPPAFRVLAATTGAIVIVAVGWGVVLVGTHYPSDVLAGMLMAGMFTAVAIGGLRRARPLRSPRPRALRLPSVLVPTMGVVALVAAGAMLTRRPTWIAGFLVDRAAFSLAAATLAIIAVTLVATVAGTPHGRRA